MKMLIDFTDKRVLVTGANDGIGRGVVEGFLAHGAIAALRGLDAASVSTTIEALGDGDRLIPVSGDISRAADARREDVRFEDVPPDDREVNLHSMPSCAGSARWRASEYEGDWK